MERHLLSQRRRSRLLIVALALGLAALIASVSAAAASERYPVQQQPTATPTSGQFQFPTATPTPIGGPTSTPTRTPTLVPVIAEIIGDPTNLRTGPGLDFDLVAELRPGVMLPIIGRWIGYDWYQVAWADAPDGKAWVYAPLVIVHGDITTIPAVEPPAPPTIDPTQAAIQATATVLLQTPGAAETATATVFFFPTGIFTQTPVAGEQVATGALPTFTPPPPYRQPQELPVPTVNSERSSGIPPAVLIIALTVMGALSLVLGLLRRLF